MADDEDEEEEPSSSGKTVGIVAVGIVIGIVAGIIGGNVYYRGSEPKIPSNNASQPTTPASSGTPGATPGATPHAFVPPAPGAASLAYRLVTR